MPDGKASFHWTLCPSVRLNGGLIVTLSGASHGALESPPVRLLIRSINVGVGAGTAPRLAPESEAQPNASAHVEPANGNRLGARACEGR